MMQVILNNSTHPEYGQATIPLPLTQDQYDDCVELLEKLDIGSATKQDCKVLEISSAFPVLKRMEMLTVNLDELDYLAKRLASFDIGEAAQFQTMAHKLELFELKDLINLTFCCQKATVINNFSDLEAIGHEHHAHRRGHWRRAGRWVHRGRGRHCGGTDLAAHLRGWPPGPDDSL